MALLEVDNLKKYFPIRKGILSRTVGYVKAVDGVSFNLKQGETLGLIGESGWGETTAGTPMNFPEASASASASPAPGP